MSSIQDEIVQVFGNKLRVRVSGICIEDQKVLLVKHHSIGEKGIFWSPPGGGVNFGESCEDSLKREFLEETHLEIEIQDFLFVHEFLNPPLHAIELFFKVKRIKGELLTGSDPEMAKNRQIIHEVKFFSLDEIRKEDPDLFHGIFSTIEDLNSLFEQKSHFLVKNSGKKSKKS